MLSISSIIVESVLTMLTGLAVVFAVLIVLWLAVVLVSKLVSGLTKKKDNTLWADMNQKGERG